MTNFRTLALLYLTYSVKRLEKAQKKYSDGAWANIITCMHQINSERQEVNYGE